MISTLSHLNAIVIIIVVAVTITAVSSSSSPFSSVLTQISTTFAARTHQITRAPFAVLAAAKIVLESNSRITAVNQIDLLSQSAIQRTAPVDDKDEICTQNDGRHDCQKER